MHLMILTIPLILTTHAAMADIKSEADKTAHRPLTEKVINDPRIAAERLLQHVNYARISLAMKNLSQAKSHINEARSLVAVLKNASAEDRKVTRVESGRLIYKNEPKWRNYYFPIETGPIDVKKVSTGPFWAENKGAAVTDAEIVYLTLNLNGDRAETALGQAVAHIDKGDYPAAQSALASLIEDTVIEEKTADLPIEKARDNLALARSFIARRNYEGARFALGHAKDALDEMDKDERYRGRKDRLTAMRGEVYRMQQDISRNDPTLIERADAIIQKWWNDLKD